MILHLYQLYDTQSFIVEHFIWPDNFQSHDEVAQLLGSSGTSACMSVTTSHKSQHTHFNEDTTNESATVACSDVRLWKLDTQREWRNTSQNLWDERAEKDSVGSVDSKEKKWVGS